MSVGVIKRILVSRKVADAAFLGGFAGLLFLMGLILTPAVQELYLSDFLLVLEHCAGTAWFIFVMSSIFLWVRALVMTVMLFRSTDKNDILYRLFFLVVGTFFAGYILYIVDRRSKLIVQSSQQKTLDRNPSG